MGDDALPYKRVALPTAEGFGELPCGHFSALLTVIVDEGADFLLQLGYLGFVGGPDVEFYFDDVFVHCRYPLIGGSGPCGGTPAGGTPLLNMPRIIPTQFIIVS